jgi:hypothetical protein
MSLQLVFIHKIGAAGQGLRLCEPGTLEHTTLGLHTIVCGNEVLLRAPQLNQSVPGSVGKALCIRSQGI